uniref:Predicted protein n=1 Tax=Hordeum vulgare subsp. vulgare TaxID=112509 RepID=F2CTZ1_HORVV|nr:predicted protein [Hordeum vulgare subsp. vulgare]
MARSSAGIGAADARPEEDSCIIPSSFDLDRDMLESEETAAIAWPVNSPRRLEALDVDRAIRKQFHLSHTKVVVTSYHPVEFLVKFNHKAHCDEALAAGRVRAGGSVVHIRPWRPLERAFGAALNYRVRLCLENVPDYAWTPFVAERIIGRRCSFDRLEDHSVLRTNSETLDLWVWRRTRTSSRRSFRSPSLRGRPAACKFSPMKLGHPAASEAPPSACWFIWMRWRTKPMPRWTATSLTTAPRRSTRLVRTWFGTGALLMASPRRSGLRWPILLQPSTQRLLLLASMAEGRTTTLDSCHRVATTTTTWTMTGRGVAIVTAADAPAVSWRTAWRCAGTAPVPPFGGTGQPGRTVGVGRGLLAPRCRSLRR